MSIFTFSVFKLNWYGKKELKTWVLDNVKIVSTEITLRNVMSSPFFREAH